MIWLAIAGALAVALGTGGKPKSLLSEWLADWRKRLRKHVDDDTLTTYVEANRAGQGWLLAALRRGGRLRGASRSCEARAARSSGCLPAGGAPPARA